MVQDVKGVSGTSKAGEAKGITKANIAKDNKKLQTIFDKFDNGDGTLTKSEIENLASVFVKADFNGNKNDKLSIKELDSVAGNLNKDVTDENNKVTKEDVRDFYSNLKEAMKSQSDKVRLMEYEADVSNEKPVEGKDNGDTKDDKAEDKTKTNSYTVQYKEHFTDIIKRSLEAKGIKDPTDDQIKEAKEAFKKNNPSAVKTSKKGVEYLLAGATVQLDGKLEDKKNGKEQEQLWKTNHKADEAANAGKGDGKAGDDTGNDGGDQNVNTDASKKAAETQGYRETWAKGIFYDNNSKTHYRYDEKTGKFTEMKYVTTVYKDGSYKKAIPAKNGDYTIQIYNKDNALNSIYIVTNTKQHMYTNMEQVAKRLGLTPTAVQGTYIYKKSYYQWDDKQHMFFVVEG